MVSTPKNAPRAVSGRLAGHPILVFPQCFPALDRETATHIILKNIDKFANLFLESIC
jgi:hypothetical protein